MDYKGGSPGSPPINKGSRIPIMKRSYSLREKKNRRTSSGCSSRDEPSSIGDRSYLMGSTTPRFGLSRSSSFACSRGMSELRASHRTSAPHTPELSRRSSYLTSSYVSPYSKSYIENERRSQRRDSTDDDICSEKSIDSTTSKLDSVPEKTLSSLPWSIFSQRAPNTVHCSHSHTHDVDYYLTPTQKMARKIRELQNQLKRAKQEIKERDDRIALLNRRLGERYIEDPSVGASERGTVSVTPTAEGALESGVYFPCDTPVSEDSEKVNFEAVELKGVDGLSLSNADSGNCDDLISPSISFKESFENISRSSTLTQESPRSSGQANRSEVQNDNQSLRSSDQISLHTTDGRNSRPDQLTYDQNDRFRNSLDGMGEDDILWDAVGSVEESMREEWEKKFEELKVNHMEEYNEMKEKYNDKVESLLSKLSDANLKYFDLRPHYDKAMEKLNRLERENSRLESELRENEFRQQKIYLQMYLKGQEAAKFEAEEINPHTGPECPQSSNSDSRRNSAVEHPEKPEWYPNSVVFGLLKQLATSEEEIQKMKMSSRREDARTRDEIDPAIKLQFLKSAVYYFLTDRGNMDDHLKAIGGILGYSQAEKGDIHRSLNL